MPSSGFEWAARAYAEMGCGCPPRLVHVSEAAVAFDFTEAAVVVAGVEAGEAVSDLLKLGRVVAVVRDGVSLLGSPPTIGDSVEDVSEDAEPSGGYGALFGVQRQPGPALYGVALSPCDLVVATVSVTEPDFAKRTDGHATVSVRAVLARDAAKGTLRVPLEAARGNEWFWVKHYCIKAALMAIYDEKRTACGLVENAARRLGQNGAWHEGATRLPRVAEHMIATGWDPDPRHVPTPLRERSVSDSVDRLLSILRNVASPTLDEAQCLSRLTQWTQGKDAPEPCPICFGTVPLHRERAHAGLGLCERGCLLDRCPRTLGIIPIEEDRLTCPACCLSFRELTEQTFPSLRNMGRVCPLCDVTLTC